MKKIFVACFVLVTAIGAWAFKYQTPIEASQVDQPVWYMLNPGGNPDNPSDYTLATSGQQLDCGGTDFVCAIYAVPDINNSNRPRFDASKTHDQVLINEINKSQNGQTPSATYVREQD